MKCWRFDGFGKLKFEEQVKNQWMYTTQSPTNLGLSLSLFFLEGGGGGGGVFPTHFNLNNSLLKLFQISLLLRCNPALSLQRGKK